MSSILNRRNAVLGWVAWRLGKRMARRKAAEHSRLLAVTGAASATALAVAGAAAFARRRAEPSTT